MIKYKIIFTLITDTGTTMHTVDGFTTRELAEQVANDWSSLMSKLHVCRCIHTTVMDYE